MDDGKISMIVQSRIRIAELEEIKNQVKKSTTEDIRLKIETRHWYGYSCDMSLLKEKSKLYISKSSLLSALNKVIFEEKNTIDKLLDMEIERRNFEAEVNRRRK